MRLSYVFTLINDYKEKEDKMVKSHNQSGTTHTHKVTLLSIYDTMEKKTTTGFQVYHKPYQFANIKSIKKGKSNV